MGKKNRKDRITDEIIHEEIMKEGARLEKELGPVTFTEAPDFDVDESFRQLMEKKESGERLLAQQEESRRKSFGRRKITKKKGKIFTAGRVAVACLVCVVCLFTFSMTSEATRMWWMKSVERVIGNESGKIIDSDENRVLTELTEKEILAEIEKVTGIPMPEFMYKPDDMFLDNYECDAVGEFALLHYNANGHTVTLEINGASTDTSIQLNREWDRIDERLVQTGYAEVTMIEVKVDEDRESTIHVQWNYNNIEYNVVGKISMDEMEKMVKSMFY